MTASGFNAAQRVDAPVGFERISALAPPILVESIGQAPFGVPDYIVPKEIKRFPDQLQARHERDTLASPDTRLGRIMMKAVELDEEALTVDRYMLIMGMVDSMDPTDFLVRFGIYTTYVRPTEALSDYAKKNGTNVVEQGLRDDLEFMLGTGAAILDKLPEAEQADFIARMAQNLAPKVVDITEARQKGRNLSIYLIRNAMIDIVGYPDSLLDPAVVMGVKIIRQMLQMDPKLKTETNTIYLNSLLDPEILVNNPETLFLMRDYLADSPITDRKQADMLSHGTVAALMQKIRFEAEPSSFPATLANFFYTIADKNIDPASRFGTQRRLPSEGGSFNVPVTLVHLARAVARKNEDRLVLTQQPAADYLAAYNYLQPMLEIAKLWPEVDSAVAETIEKALGTVIAVAAPPAKT